MRVLKLDEHNNVVCIRYNASVLLDNEIESEQGELGQRMLEDGTFVDVPVDPIESEPSIEEQILTETQYQTVLLEMQLFGGM